MADSNPGRKTLSQHRLELEGFRRQLKDLLEKWGEKPYEEKEMVFQPYLHLLFTTRRAMHKDKDDVMADLTILEDLQNALQPNIAEGMKNYIQFQIAIIYARKKLGLLLQEVDRRLKKGIIVPDGDYQEWIDQVLRDEDWKRYLEFVNQCEYEVLKKANVRGVQIVEQNITRKDMVFETQDDIRKLLEMYRKEVADARSMPKDNVDCIGDGPSVVEFINKIMTKLTDRRDKWDDDGSKVEGQDGIQTMIAAMHC